MATLDVDQFTTARRSDNRPRPYSRLETDEELLARATVAYHAQGGSCHFVLTTAKEVPEGIYPLWVCPEEVESQAKKYGVTRCIVWVSP